MLKNSFAIVVLIFQYKTFFNIKIPLGRQALITTSLEVENTDKKDKITQRVIFLSRRLIIGLIYQKEMNFF